VINVTNHDVLLVQEDNQTKQVDVANPGGGVMMQAFIGCPRRWNVVEYYKYKKSLLGQMLELVLSGFRPVKSSKRSILHGL
jgi:hypothetical protein